MDVVNYQATQSAILAANAATSEATNVYNRMVENRSSASATASASILGQNSATLISLGACFVSGIFVISTDTTDKFYVGIIIDGVETKDVLQNLGSISISCSFRCSSSFQIKVYNNNANTSASSTFAVRINYSA